MSERIEGTQQSSAGVVQPVTLGHRLELDDIELKAGLTLEAALDADRHLRMQELAGVERLIEHALAVDADEGILVEHEQSVVTDGGLRVTRRTRISLDARVPKRTVEHWAVERIEPKS